MALPSASMLAYNIVSTFSNKIVLTDTTGVISYLNLMNKWLANTNLTSDHYKLSENVRVWNIDAGCGNDTINASQSHANNNLSGGDGKDAIFGGYGNDRIDGGKGNDDLTGGAGLDSFVLSAGNDIIRDFLPTTKTSLLIDFEGITSSGAFAEIPANYAGLTWTNAYALGKDLHPGSGYVAAINSGQAVGFDGFAEGLSFSDTLKDFDFVSGYFAAAWNNGLALTIEAYDDNVLVGTATLSLDPTQTFVVLADYSNAGNRFTSIDKVVIDGAGGTPWGSDGSHVAMDDLLLNYGAPGDVIDVSNGYDVAALAASAATDGHGGTLLTHSQGTVTLVGVDPWDVSEAWFV